MLRSFKDLFASLMQKGAGNRPFSNRLEKRDRMQTDFIVIGQIKNTHGIKGQIKVMPFTDFPERFRKMEKVWVEQRDGSTKEYEIEDVKYQKQWILLKLSGVEDMTTAESMKGLQLVITRENVFPLPEDSYYIFDLVGCQVFEGQELLGPVKEVIQTGSNDVYVVEYNNSELLIPALKWVVLSVDIENKRIEVALPKGLKEL